MPDGSQHDAKGSRCLAFSLPGIDYDEPAPLRHEPEFRMVWIKINLKLKIKKTTTLEVWSYPAW